MNVFVFVIRTYDVVNIDNFVQLNKLGIAIFFVAIRIVYEIIQFEKYDQRAVSFRNRINIFFSIDFKVSENHAFCYNSPTSASSRCMI